MIIIHTTTSSLRIESESIQHHPQTIVIDSIEIPIHYDHTSQSIVIDTDPALIPIDTQPLIDGHASSYRYNEQLIVIHCVADYHYTLTSTTYNVDKDMLSIGKSNDNDIVIDLPWINDHHGYINMITHQFTGEFISNYGDKTRPVIDVLDVIDIDGLTMVFTQYGLTIMDSDLIHIHLSERPSSLMANMHYPFRQTHSIHQHTLVYHPINLSQTIPNVFLEQPSFHVPLFVTMGPMLIMGIASLASAGFMAYQRYWQGDDLIDSIPSLILPAVLIISTIVFQPLNRWFENRRNTASTKKRFADFELQWSHLRSQGEQAYIAFKQRLDQCYPSTDTLIERFSDSMVHSYTREIIPLIIRLGQGDVHTNFRIDGIDQYMVQPLLYQRLCQYKDELSIAKSAKIIQLTTDQTIKLIDTSNQLYTLILTQLITGYAMDQLKIVYLVEPSFLYDHPEVFYDPYTVDDDQWLVYFDPSTLIQYVQSTSYKIIVFSQQYIDTKLDAIIIYIDQDDIPTDIAMINDQGVLDLYTPQTHDHFQLDPLPSNFDITKAIDQWFPLHRRLGETMDIFSACGLVPFTVDNYLDRCMINDQTDCLIASFGLDDRGIFSLDLAENGDGPHGLIAGTTGSGKSECALALMVALALCYSPDKVNFLVVDFKGSALASQLAKLPHYVGTLDNLSINEVHRFLNALRFETKKRQRLMLQLSQKSNLTINGIDQYRKVQTNYPSYEPMAHLVVLIDEFAELKAQVPEFIDAIISLARIGRSLGIHLILSTQKPNGVVNDQILANTRFRLCLRVNDKSDSMEMLNTAMAVDLNHAGEFYCVKDAGIQHAQSFYLNGNYDPSHRNIHGSIMDLSNGNTKQIHVIKSDQTYMDRLIPLIQQAYPNKPWILNPPVMVESFKLDMTQERLRFGHYDDLSTMAIHELTTAFDTKRFLFVGSPSFTMNLIYGYLYQGDVFDRFNDAIVIIISDSIDIQGCECIQTDQIKRIDMILTTLNHRKNEKVILIIDGVDDLYRRYPTLNDQLILLDNQCYITMVLTMHHGNSALLRNFTKIDQIIIDASCDITIKSLFFTSLKAVAESKTGFGYVPHCDESIALFQFDAIDHIHDSHRRLPDPSIPFKISLNCFAKSYYLDQAYPLSKGMVFTAASRLRLKQFKTLIEQLHPTYTLSDTYDPNGISFLSLDTFNDPEIHYLYEQTQVIFIGGGIHQQFIFPFSQFEENEKDDAIYIYCSTMVKLRLGSLL